MMVGLGLARVGGLAALGADSAFEHGALSISPDVRLYTADSDIPDWAFTQAAQFHPAWDRCSDYARRLHARNSLILFGVNGPDDPEPRNRVSHIICWTPNAAITGGTGQALRLAAHFSSPVRNLADPATLDRARTWLASTP
jgi:hypothetical protein